jgi:transcriptional regulator with XRE-family HTH domain
VHGAELLAQARRASGLSQSELARRSETSRPTVSAYEHGRKSPTLQTAARLLHETGFELDIRPLITFVEVVTARGRTVSVPTSLPRLPVEQAVAVVVLPIHLNWSVPGRSFDLADRAQRARMYEIVLREGAPDDVLTFVDGALLVDLWDELVLPREVRAAWNPLIHRTTVVAA